jgi:hypothetical protein
MTNEEKAEIIFNKIGTYLPIDRQIGDFYIKVAITMALMEIKKMEKDSPPEDGGQQAGVLTGIDTTSQE